MARAATAAARTSTRPQRAPSRKQQRPARRRSGPARKPRARRPPLVPRVRLPPPRAPASLPLPQRLELPALGPAAAGLLDRLLRGRVWVFLIGTLLVGIVFFNVDVLRLNRTIAATTEKATKLKQENARLVLEQARPGVERAHPGRKPRASAWCCPPPARSATWKSHLTRDARHAAQRMTAPNPVLPPEATSQTEQTPGTAPAATGVTQTTTPPTSTTTGQPTTTTQPQTTASPAPGASQPAPGATASPTPDTPDRHPRRAERRAE